MAIFMVRLPGNFYPYDFRVRNEQEARKRMRDSLGVQRLPKGTEIWKAPPDYPQSVVEANRKIGMDLRTM